MANISVKSPLDVETMALYTGLKMAANMNCTNICVATDSATCAVICNDNIHSDTNLILLCKDLLRELGNL